MNATLAGHPVVVTRPARQATRFLARLGELGATAVAYPTIVIEPVPVDPARRAALAASRYDWVIYTSTNAVELSLALVGRQSGAKIAAIGRATARALAAAGLEPDALPASGADSEALLALPEFGDPAGRSILVVKGVGGRDALRSVLESRGARVDCLEVYRRALAAPDPAADAALSRACADGATLVAATSVEVLESLLRIAPDAVRDSLVAAGLVVPGERVAAAAHRLGWRGRVTVATSAEDESMIEALVRAAGDGLHTPA